MLKLEGCTISKKGTAHIIRIRTKYEKTFAKLAGKDIIVFIGSLPAINGQVSSSFPRYFIAIPSKNLKSKSLQRYFGKTFDIIVELTKNLKRSDIN